MNTSGNGWTCAVIGAGLGGCALVGAMALHGYRMRLHDLDDARLREIRARGGILGLGGKSTAQIRRIFEVGPAAG